MKKDSKAYRDYALVQEMMETVAVIRGFHIEQARQFAPGGRPAFLTGEGSSRIFPAKAAVVRALAAGAATPPVTEGATQAAEYVLDGHALYVASNSGKTAEAVRLVDSTKNQDIKVTSIVADGDSPLARMADRTFALSCGRENAIAATKSVVEQALFYHAALGSTPDGPATLSAADLRSLAEGFDRALSAGIPGEVVDAACRATTLYFAGRSNGVAEELTLKANEITRRKSDYLEGTYLVHGIEEVMESNDLLVLVDPFAEEEEKIHRTLVDGVGLTAVAIAARETSFPTIRIPDAAGLNPYLQLAAGWNLLVEIGLSAGVNLDKPIRARKVGNEYRG